MLLYYYMTTFSEEVDLIWPQPRWKLGKLLYLGSRYFNVVSIGLNIAGTLPTNLKLTDQGCTVLSLLRMQIGSLALHFTKAVFYLCTYALLGGTQRYLRILIFAFLVQFIALQILNWYINLAGSVGTGSKLHSQLGYACVWKEPSDNATYRKLYSAASLISFIVASISFLAGLLTFLVRYQRTNNGLIRAIRREGIYFYVFALVANLLSALRYFVSSKDSTADTVLGCFNLLGRYLVPIFSDRLLLYIQRLEGSTIDDELSRIIFKPIDYSIDTDPDESDYDEKRDVERPCHDIHLIGEGKRVADRSGVRGKSVYSIV
ncbi:hypothetical protein DFP72DRAFT_900759 [Ephemerocybe angulata]|uniref:DUF6533 domain-containing protein n=1 Tax=Ephemerocybe angulata TaxID=980116 RepID=A0A8H6HY22_9AGAR|nr:hypothetical protein DFP72DRAFT_900759 [Tulosesus angulatus]